MRLLPFLAIAALLTLGEVARTARAEEPESPAPLADRAKILRTEMRRGPAADLAPYLAPDAHPALKKQAIRALGRIGDRAGAPEWIAKLLGGGADHVEALQAAALNAAPSLEGPVVAHLASKDPLVQAAAIEALGWIAFASVADIAPPKPQVSDIAVRCAAACAPFLHSKSPPVCAAALDALARCRQEAYLERVFDFVFDDAKEVMDAAWFATWMLAGARKRVGLAMRAGDWRGGGTVATYLLMGGTWEGEDALNRLRPLGILQPTHTKADPSRDTTWVWKNGRASWDRATDPRIAQELIARLLAPRTWGDADDYLATFLEHADPKVRQAAAEALGEHGKEQVVAVLQKAGAKEQDDRVRGAIAAGLLKAGVNDVGRLAEPLKEIADPQEKALFATRIAVATKDPKMLAVLATWALKHLDNPLSVLLVLGALEETKDPSVAALVAKCLEAPDPYVRAAAVGIVGKQALVEHLAALDPVLEAARSHAERDVRQAVVEAWAEFVKAGKPDDDGVKVLRARISEAARSDPAFTARAAARLACKELNIDGCPDEDPLQPNDWQGLPRPKQPILGLDLTKGGPWLDEAEILQLADLIAKEQPEYVVQNDIEGEQAAFRLAIDPSEAPVHAVSFVLAATMGAYDGTTWHRVVPSFVIQGGDPHGDGSGDAGWSVPDEITRARFVRGALGMPKGNIRDTGGCQLFVMHSDYRPLDGRYTCYGHVAGGMDTVDKIRVGDRITGVRAAVVSREAGVFPR